ncbi:uncharacterized protein [Cherax quadricarinatus]|uniref:uncharacterized protein isoform X2 n=1 Tax=Cherax quadricarinatus TaxID=27406 RepID=UPI0023799321|nr:uncharacterized protein LOC128702188 isoform X2 [Cherax quadricarinatus]
MDTDDLRSYRWNNSHSNSNKGATTSPKITSSLWKQLSEECDSVKTPGLHSSCLTENLSPSEKDVSFNSSSSASHSQDLWHTQQSPASGQSDVTFQVIHSDPWETLTNQTKASRDLTELSISNLTSSAFRQSDIDVNRIPKIGTEENTSSLFTKDVRYGKYEPGVIGTELNEPTNPASQLFPSHSYPPSSIWNENTEIPTNSSFPLSSSQNESFKLHNSLAWNNIMSSVPQRSVLHDIGNVNYPSVAAPASDFTCQKLPSSYNASAPELCDSQRTIAFHPQKQHTG